MRRLADWILTFALVAFAFAGGDLFGRAQAPREPAPAPAPYVVQLASASPSQWTTSMAALVHADDGASVKLPGGRTLWIFGDTTWSDGTPICEPGACPYGLPHDSFVVESSSGALSTVHCNCPYKLQEIPNQGSTILWANGGAVDGSTLYVFADDVQITGPATFDFAVTGASVAEFNATTLAWIKTVNYPFATIENINMAVRYGSGWAVFATSGDPKQMDVAYVPLGKLATPSAWHWYRNLFAWDGRTFLGTTLSVIHSAATGWQWVMFTKDDDFLGGEIDRLTASTPYGPWTDTSQWIINPPTGQGNGEYTYSVQAHPEQAAPAGDVLISYAVNGGPDSDYHLQFLDLPLVALSPMTAQFDAWQASFAKYRAQVVASLAKPCRTGAPIMVSDGKGGKIPASPAERKSLCSIKAGG